EGAFSNAVIDVRLRCVRHHHRRNGHRRHHRSDRHRRRRSAPPRLHRRDSHRRHHRSAAPNRNPESHSCGQSTSGSIHSCGPRRSRKLTDTTGGCLLPRSYLLSQPIHSAKKASTPALRDTHIQQVAWLTPTLWCGAPSQSCCTRCRYGGRCLSNCQASCPAELHAVTAPTDATYPTAAAFRRAPDTYSSRAAVAPGSCAPSPCLADRGLSSSRCSRHLRCRVRSCCCLREAAHCASPGSTEHWPAQPDYWPFHQPTADAVRCAPHFPDSRSVLHRIRARRSYCPA